MKKDDRWTIGWSRFGISHIQNAGIDLLQLSERCVRPWRDGRQRLGCLCHCGIEDAKLNGRSRYGSAAR